MAKSITGVKLTFTPTLRVIAIDAMSTSVAMLMDDLFFFWSLLLVNISDNAVKKATTASALMNVNTKAVICCFSSLYTLCNYHKWIVFQTQQEVMCGKLSILG